MRTAERYSYSQSLSWSKFKKKKSLTSTKKVLLTTLATLEQKCLLFRNIK